MSQNADDVVQLEEAIQKYVRPQTFPVGVRRFEADADIPSNAKRPLRDLGFRVAICQALGIARKYGWSLALKGEDLSCPVASLVHGFEEMTEAFRQGRSYEGMYNATLEAGQSTAAQVPRCEYHEQAGYVISPLFKKDYALEIAVIYGNPAQVLRLIHAYLWKRGGRMSSSTSGAVDCADILTRTLRTGESQYVLPCYGDRIFGGVSDDEMVFAIPRHQFSEIAGGLEGTYKAGIRYPIPQYLRFEGVFPAKYEAVRKGQ
ncbi:MAG: DUF169 domain-containing protein [Thermoplasmata archaeon]